MRFLGACRPDPGWFLRRRRLSGVRAARRSADPPPPRGCRNSMFAGGAQAGCLRRKGGYTGPCGLIGAPRAHPGPCGAFPPWYGLAARGAGVEGPGKSKRVGFCISCSLRAVREAPGRSATDLASARSADVPGGFIAAIVDDQRRGLQLAVPAPISLDQPAS